MLFDTVRGRGMAAFILAALALACGPAAAQSIDDGADSILEITDLSSLIAEDMRYSPSPRPSVPEPQNPPLSNEKNVDTGKPFHEWQRITDDWFGLRPRLDDAGISIEIQLATEYAKNLMGGADTAGAAFQHLLNVNLTLDLERLARIKGGTVFLNFQNRDGQSAGDETGSVQTVSNMDAPRRTQLSELWYEQAFFDGKLRLKGGKIDVNRDFAATEFGGEFLNASMGVSPAILGIPTYPDPATGGSVVVEPADWFAAGFGLYDGATHQGIATGLRGPATLFGDPSDLFLIGEAGPRWKLSGDRGGGLAVGGWHHTGTFERFDGGSEDGATGAYAVADQLLWRENPGTGDDDQGIGIFLQFGCADAAISPVECHLGGGLQWKGPIPTRDDDVAGLGATWVRLSDAHSAGFDDNSELAIEVFYKCQALKFLSIKADLQYIHNPGGVADQSDALSLLVRAVFQF